MEKLILLEPREIFNNMIVGISYQPFAVVYDKDKLIEYWAEEFLKRNPNNLSKEEAYLEALDHFDFNTQGAYVGGHSPIFVSLEDKEKLLEFLHEPLNETVSVPKSDNR
jgi:hypothetical protein